MALILLVCFVISIATFPRCGFAQQQCGSDGVACIGLPTNCTSGSDTSKCDFVGKVYATPSETSSYGAYGASPASTVRIELTAVPNGPNKLGNPSIRSRWFAVGFSETGGMPSSPVVHCFTGQTVQAVAKLTWNIPAAAANIGYAGIDQTPLTVVKTSMDSGGLSCIVDLQKQFTIEGVAVDLTKPHFLIDATGPVTTNGVIADSLDPHDNNPTARATSPKSFVF